jgi:hypothetical protein
MAGRQHRLSVGKLERFGGMQRVFRFTLQELNLQTSHLYRNGIGEHSRSMRSQDLNISAISLNVHLEWMFGYGRNDSSFSQSYVSILPLAWKDQITYLRYHVFQCHVYPRRTFRTINAFLPA